MSGTQWGRMVVAWLCAIVVAPVGVVALAGAPAQAAYSYLCRTYDSCSKAGYSHYDYKSKKGTSYWNMVAGNNCTNYVAFRYATRKHGRKTGKPWSGDGNAYNWGKLNKTDSTPKVGATAWWAANAAPASWAGHVAYVEKVVSSSEIWVSESNYGAPAYGLAEFGWIKVTKSGGGWPSGFIHFSDEKLHSTKAPAVSGTAKVGSKLTAGKGSWESSSGKAPTSSIGYKYQWLANGSSISGATSSTYTPTAGVVGKKISVKVSVSASGYGGTSATSSQTGAVAAAAFTNKTAPAISGAPRVGAAVSVSTGSWSPTPDGYQYQWYADGVVIEGATGSSYTPDATQLGRVLTARVTVSKTGYPAANKVSAGSAPVLPGTFSIIASPAVAGVPTVGQQLSLLDGVWEPAPDAVTYQWLADGAPIEGATDPTLTLDASHLGAAIAVVGTASKVGYDDSPAASSPTTPVVPGTIASLRPPSVLGAVVVGGTVRVDPAEWDPADSASTYQWYADDVAIDGAVGTRLNLSPALLGAVISVSETASRPGYLDSVVRSAATEPVAPGTIRKVVAPKMRGKALVGTRLRVSAGRWLPGKVTRSYQWYAGSTELRGQRKPMLAVRKAHLGKRLKVKVVITLDGYRAVHVKVSAGGKVRSARR